MRNTRQMLRIRQVTFPGVRQIAKPKRAATVDLHRPNAAARVSFASMATFECEFNPSMLEAA